MIFLSKSFFELIPGFQLSNFFAFLFDEHNLKTSLFFGLILFLSILTLILLLKYFEIISSIHLIEKSFPEPILIISPSIFFASMQLIKALTVSSI